MKNKRTPQFLLKVLGWLSHSLWWLADLALNSPWGLSQKLKERQRIIHKYPIPHLKSAKPVALYFCSSAGEFEQALPLMERLKEMKSVVCFFSPSGISYAEKRAEVSYFFFPGDRKNQMQQIFETLSPTLVVVNRWELWPNFLMAARKHSYLCLINFALTDPTRNDSILERNYKRALLCSFNELHCIGPVNALYAENLLNRPVKIGTDTKYDRVLDRSESLWTELSTLQTTSIGRHLRQHLKAIQVLVMGSSWKEDHALLFPILGRKKRWSVIVCPHDISKSNIDLCCEQLHISGLSYSLYSELPTEGLRTLDAIVIDNIGMLAEVYSAGDAAWVGGGCHYRIHNTLEPASYNLPLAFGPMYQTSIEATLMVKTGVALSTDDSDTIERWLDAPGPKTRKFVEERAGGANILAELLRKEIKECR